MASIGHSNLYKNDERMLAYANLHIRCRECKTVTSLEYYFKHCRSFETIFNVHTDTCAIAYQGARDDEIKELVGYDNFLIIENHPHTTFSPGTAVYILPKSILGREGYRTVVEIGEDIHCTFLPVSIEETTRNGINVWKALIRRASRPTLPDDGYAIFRNNSFAEWSPNRPSNVAPALWSLACNAVLSEYGDRVYMHFPMAHNEPLNGEGWDITL